MNTPDNFPNCGASRIEGREYACGFIFREGVKNNPRPHECLLNSEVSAHAATKRELEKAKSDASMWCPDRCPITFRPFFMWLEHPEKGLVPTYGGPFDSYTIPEPEMPEDGKKTEFHDIEFYCERYDHDEGAWVDGSEDPGHRVIIQDRLADLLELDAMKARVRELEVELSQSFELAEGQLQAEKLAGNIVKEEFWKGELAALHRMRRALGEAMPGGASVVHGKTCPKAPHIGTGHLHAEDDDKPYDVDGVCYCGRCHTAMPGGGK